MGALVGVIAWLITLIPVIYKFILFITQKIIPKIGQKGATAGTITIGATLTGFLATAGIIGAMASAVYLFHLEMFALVRDYILPVFGYVIKPVANMVASFLPSADNAYFSLFMGFFNAFDIATPISIIVLCYAFAATLGLYMRTFKI
jgi:hypothetical protein